MQSELGRGRLRGGANRAAAKLVEDNGAGLRTLLPARSVEQAAAAEGVRCRDCLFTPLVTLWMFLAQVLSADGSCREAVAKLLAFLAAASRATGVPAGLLEIEDRDRSVLQGAQASAGVSGVAAGPGDGIEIAPPPPFGGVVGRKECEGRRWNDLLDARHTGEPEGVAAARYAEAGAGVPAGAAGGGHVAELRGRAGCRDGSVQGQADR